MLYTGINERSASARPESSRVTRRRAAALRKGEVLVGFILIAPTAIGLGIFTLWPALQTFFFSFTEWGTFGGNTWTGLANYVQVMQDPELLRSLGNTAVLTCFALAGIPIAIALAALLNTRDLRGLTVYRVIYFLPVVTLPAAVALVWKFILSGDYGLLNAGLSVFGIDGPNWVSDPATAIFAIGVIAIWGSLGYNMILFLAGLQSIPREIYEAASIDGASRIRTFFSVTVPLLSPTTFFVMVITVIGALQTFDLIYLMIGINSPALPATKTIVYLFYEKGIIQGDGGYAAAIAFVLLAIIALLTLIQFKVQKRWVQYD